VWTIGLPFPDCNTIKKTKLITVSNKTSNTPAETILHGNSRCVALEFLVIEIVYCTGDLFQHGIQINVGIVTVQTLKESYNGWSQICMNVQLDEVCTSTCTMVAAPLSISAREKPNPHTRSRLHKWFQQSSIIRSDRHNRTTEKNGSLPQNRALILVTQCEGWANCTVVQWQ
jgi:hypothetical protein